MGIERDLKQSISFRNIYHKASVNLIFTGRWVINFHNELFNDYGITIQQYNILKILKGSYPDPVTVKNIFDSMIDKSSDASRIVEVLRKKGFAERNLNSCDRRKVDVIITEKGLEILSEIDKNVEIMDSILGNLSTKEAEQLNSLLDKARN